jgi:hypothetical protein
MDDLEIPVIDEMDEELPDFHLGKEIAKSLTLSAAETAGIVGGFIAVAYAFGAGQKLRAHFNKKKAEPKVHTITDLPEKKD